MQRRDFLLAAAAGLGTTVLTRRLGAQGTPAVGQVPVPSPTPAPLVTQFHALRRKVGYFTGRGGTIGWLVSSDGLAAVDTQFPEPASRFLADLPGREGRLLDVVVNTHHHADHTGGNGVFRPVSRTLVAHEKVPALQRAAAARGRQPSEPPVEPDQLFSETWRLPLGDEVVSARHFGPAHTGADIVVFFEKANVVHMGDLMFNRMYPVIDRPGGAHIRGWIGVLEKVAAEYPADAIFLHGHGNPKFGVRGERGDLLVLRDYLTGLLEHVQREVKAGRTKDEIVRLENLPGFPDFHAPAPNRLALNLSVAFDELTSGPVSV
jgi:cyclase